jgi:hypothetical protein
MKTMLALLMLAAGLTMFTGCASTRKTEAMLSEAGFGRFKADTYEQTNHLQSLPADRLTVIQLGGKTFYVFPDPARNQIFVGNTEQYQTYQQILSYSELERGSRVEASLDPPLSDGRWAAWSSQTGWVGGNIQ